MAALDYDPRALPRFNLALIGGRGCGKSSVSRRLIRKKKRFILFSLDDLIRYEAGGRRVPEIVAEEGWHRFRERETAVLQRACAFERAALLDCGGGIVVKLKKDGTEVMGRKRIELLRKSALVVYLQRDIDYLVRRVEGDTNRPSLSDTEGFREIMERRDPWYRRAAHHVLEATELSKPEIVDALLDIYHAHERDNP